MVFFSEDVSGICWIFSTCSPCTPLIFISSVISERWYFLNHQETCFDSSIQQVHTGPSDLMTLQQKCLKQDESSSVWRNVKPFCHCESLISGVDLNRIANHCCSFPTEQPHRSRDVLWMNYPQMSVLDTNRSYPVVKFASKDFERKFESLIQSTKQTINLLVSLDWFATDLLTV